MIAQTGFDFNTESPDKGEYNFKNSVIETKPAQWRMLALDIAANTGFCTNTASGTWKFALKKDESTGMRLIRFTAKLKEVCALEQINLIVFEQLAIYSKYPNFVAAEMVGALKLFCAHSSIEFKSYAPAAIKKFGTGKGNANKDLMVSAAKKYKATITDDNEADAVILYHFAISDLQL